MGTLSRADLAALDLWTACPMTFHVGHGQFEVIPRYTPCRKPVYTQAMRTALDHKAPSAQRRDDQDFWVYVDLKGLQRTLLRSTLLTKREYDDERERERAALAMLRSKSGRLVAEGGADGGDGIPLVAGAHAAGAGAHSDD
jgi:hypothetical protein